MKSKLLLLAVFVLLGARSWGQSFECGTDYVHDQLMQTDSIYKQNYLAHQKQIQNIIQNQSYFKSPKKQVYTIPVVVHIIHLGESIGTGSNITDAQVQIAINGLNDRFRNVIGTGVDIELEFCLAVRDPNGYPTNGINRVDGSGVTNYVTNGIYHASANPLGADESDIKDLSKWPVCDYYNIWVVNNIGWAGGYAYYPTSCSYAYDGTVIIYNAMTYNSGTLAHELGHGFDLMHTFEGDSNGSICPPNAACNLDGDQVCDTPPHKRGDCASTNPCTGTGVWDNSRYNYMSYCFPAFNIERFTAGQKLRTDATLTISPRADLLNSLGCDPCSLQTINISANNPCEGSTLYLTAPTLSGAIYSWTGPNGFSSTQQNPSITNVTQAAQGSYQCSITVSGCSNTNNASILVDINNAPIVSLISSSDVSCNGNNDGSATVVATPINAPTQVTLFEENFDAYADQDFAGVVSPYMNTWTLNPGGTNDCRVTSSESYSPLNSIVITGPNTGGAIDAMVVFPSNYTAGRFEYSMKYKVAAGMGAYFNVQSSGSAPGTAWLAEIYFAADGSGNMTAGGQSLTFNYTNGAWIDILIEMDIDTDLGRIWIDGVQVGTGFTISLESGGGGTGANLSFGGINLYSGSGDPSADCEYYVDDIKLVEITNGVASYSYLWSDGQTGPNAIGLSAGAYSVTATDVNGCIGNTNITIAQPNQISLSTTVTDATCNNCDGYASVSANGGTLPYLYQWNDPNNQTTQVASGLCVGTYYVTVSDSNGCFIIDSAVVNNTSAGAATETVCDTYTAPDGAVYTSTGIYTAIIPNAAGCDSTITIDLIVNNTSTGSVTQTACDTYTAPDGAVYTSTGTYTAIIPNAAGCDSTISIDLTVNTTSTGSATETVCDTYTAPDGAVYTSTGIYTAVIPNAVGCDSTITIDLTVITSTASSVTESACDSYTAVGGAVYTSTGTYTSIIPNSAGCDSVVSLDLTINTVNIGVIQNQNILTSSQTGAIYQWAQCPTMATLPGENSQTLTATFNSDYAVIVNYNGCVDTSACYTVSTVAIIENDFGNALLIYPNPTDGDFTIDLGANYASVTITLTDINGKLIQTNTYNESQLLNLKLEEAAGVYLLIIEAEGKKAMIRLVKE